MWAAVHPMQARGSVPTHTSKRGCGTGPEDGLTEHLDWTESLRRSCGSSSFSCHCGSERSRVLDENKDRRQSAQHVRGNKSLSETVESQNQDVSCIVPPVHRIKAHKARNSDFRRSVRREPLRKQAEKDESQLRNPLGASMPRSRMYTRGWKMGDTL